jgi:hypothetical protein
MDGVEGEGWVKAQREAFLTPLRGRSFKETLTGAASEGRSEDVDGKGEALRLMLDDLRAVN